MKRKSERALTHSELDALRHSPGHCTCQKLRSAARATTRMYDDYLRPTGLTIGQYSALAALYYVPSMPMSKLATRLEMDRTTLTRSLAILERDRLISIEPDAEDTRIRAISITNAGLQKLIDAFPLWKAAQETMETMLGARPLKAFRASLDQSIDSLKTYSPNEMRPSGRTQFP